MTSFAFSNVQVGVVGDGPYALWSALRDLPPGTETADPDGDGHATLLEYATGSDPTNAATAGPLSIVGAGAAFARATNATDVTLIVEQADALAANWTGLATNRNGSWGGTTNVNESGTGTPVAVTVTPPAGTNAFLRLRIVRP